MLLEPILSAGFSKSGRMLKDKTPDVECIVKCSESRPITSQVTLSPSSSMAV